MKNKKSMAKIGGIFVLAVLILSLATVIIAEGGGLEEERAQLMAELEEGNWSYLVNSSLNISHVFVENYSCNSTGYETSKVFCKFCKQRREYFSCF